MAKDSETQALYQRDGGLRKHSTTISSIATVSTLSEADRPLFKTASDDDYVLTTADTIFYAQGGGQPSDTGTIKSCDGAEPSLFEVSMVRNGSNGQILHVGKFASPESRQFSVGEAVEQVIDGSKRDLHSRIHTAGHILGLAVRELKDEITDITELKAQHYPDAAFVEFRGLIDGKHKAAIQKKADELVEKALPVEVVWWEEPELQEKCAAVIDSVNIAPGTLTRAVDIVGVGAYPCGGTHILDTSQVGKLVVRNIKRQKGITKISYAIE